MARLTSKKIVWFDIPGDEDNARVQIVHLKPGELQDIKAETTRWVGKSQDSEFVTELEMKPEEQLRRVRIAAIVGWENFYDADGKMLSCNKENKELFLYNDPVIGEPQKPFSEWIDEFRQELAKEMRPQEEQAMGN